MTIKNRLAKLEKKRGGEIQIRVFYVNHDGSAYARDAAGNRTEYTAAEFEQHTRECEARGETVLLVRYASDVIAERGN